MKKVYYRYDHQKQFAYGQRIPEGNWRVYVGEVRNHSLDSYLTEDQVIKDYFFPASARIADTGVIEITPNNRKVSSLIGKQGCIIKFNQDLFGRKIVIL